MNEENKKRLLDIFSESKELSQETGKVYIVCENCKYNDTLKPGTTIYSQSFSKKRSVMTEDEYALKCDDPILPRTKDYTCPNKECKSHKSIKNKEAVFFRIQDTLNVVYVCCACKTHWFN